MDLKWPAMLSKILLDQTMIFDPNTLQTQFSLSFLVIITKFQCPLES